MGLQIEALPPLPEVDIGDDLAGLIGDALAKTQLTLHPGDILIIAQKVVSRREGRLRKLDRVRPSKRALELAHGAERDPRLVQIVLDESRSLLREHPVLIAETHHGFICANAGVDLSNAPYDDTAVLLPTDPDASARELRRGLSNSIGVSPAVLITDSFGRAWRLGQCDIAIGCAGLVPLDDWRGRRDAGGRALNATLPAIADQIAAVADLARAKDSMQPVVLVRGLSRYVTAEDGPGARALLRPREKDLFR